MNRERIAALLQQAIDRGLPTHTPEDILHAVRLGEMQLWQHPDMQTLIVTSLQQYPRLKAARVEYVAGRMQDVMEMKPAIEKWGRANGCEIIIAGGRKGWVRVLQDYRVSATQVYKEL